MNTADDKPSRKRPATTRRRRRPGLRFRVTLYATLIATAGMTLGGIGIVAWVRGALIASTDQTLADDVTAAGGRLKGGILPDRALLADTKGRETVSRLVSNGAGVIVPQSTDGTVLVLWGPGLGALLADDQATLGADRPSLGWRIQAGNDNAKDDIPGVLVSFDDAQTPDTTWQEHRAKIEAPSGTVNVLAAGPPRDTQRSIVVVRDMLWVLVPAGAAGVALMSWVVTGTALKPVRRIIGQVKRIETATLSERVEEPTGQDEIAELAATMNEMLERLEKASVAQRQFVSDASHELRSPLAAIRIELDLLQDAADRQAQKEHQDRGGKRGGDIPARAAEPEPGSDTAPPRRPEETDWEAHSRDAAEIAEAVETVSEESRRLEGIVDDLLALAKGNESAPIRGATDVDIDEILLAEATRSRRIRPDVTNVSAGRVCGDATDLGRLFTHLLDNASRHARSRVEAGLTQQDGWVTGWVDDDGEGVEEPQREAIFERFVRLDESRERDRGGSGLGLAVVRSIAMRHGGTVRCTQAPLGGARFEVRLPAAPA